MARPDESSRRLRGAIGVAVRDGRVEDEAALRRELAMANLERALAREIGDQPLTAAELLRLRTALESYGPRRMAAVPRSVERVAVS